jgi:uracil-DNA glycosylase
MRSLSALPSCADSANVGLTVTRVPARERVIGGNRGHQAAEILLVGRAPQAPGVLV